MRGRARYLAALTTAVVLLVFVGVAFGFTSADWEPRALKWQNVACTQATLNSKESLATNQKIALCFALSRLEEDKTYANRVTTALEETGVPILEVPGIVKLES